MYRSPSDAIVTTAKSTADTIPTGQIAGACLGHRSHLPNGIPFPRVPRPTAGAAVVLFCVSVLAGMATVIDEPMLMLCAGAVAGLGLAGMVHPRPAHLHLAVRASAVCEVGTPTVFEVVVTNADLRAVPGCELTFHVDGFSPLALHFDPLRPQQSQARRVSRTPLARGVVERASMEVRVTDPLGLTSRGVQGSLTWEQVIHPATVAPVVIESYGGKDFEAAVTTYVPGAEFAGTRQWRRGDARRQVHWRSTARHGRPIVVERVSAPARGLVVVLAGSPRTAEDELIWAAAAATVGRAMRQREPLDVIALGPDGWMKAPDHSLRAVRDWFSTVAHVQVPSPGAAAAQVPAGTGRVALAACTDVPPEWPGAFRAALPGASVTVIPAGSLSPAQNAALGADVALGEPQGEAASSRLSVSSRLVRS